MRSFKRPTGASSTSSYPGLPPGRLDKPGKGGTAFVASQAQDPLLGGSGASSTARYIQHCILNAVESLAAWRSSWLPPCLVLSPVQLLARIHARPESITADLSAVPLVPLGHSRRDRP